MPLQATSGAASYDAFGGGVAAVPNYIEDVFSTWLYTGNGSAQTINNGIDTAGEGALVWLKARSGTYSTGDHFLFDTNRGTYQILQSNNADGQFTYGSDGALATSSGWSITGANTNNSSTNYVSWTFRKQPKFFDVVTYTGNGAARTIAHNLGSTPGCIIVKQTSAASNWMVYHRGLTSAQYILNLNNTGPQSPQTSVWNSTDPTSTVFSVGADLAVNDTGQTYVAYLFAHNAGGFGLTGTDNVISCGSYTAIGGGTPQTINLGYEPQWVLVKTASDVNSWFLFDNMRGMSETASAGLTANTANAESSLSPQIIPKATGFTSNYSNVAGQSHIYIAIRRGPMKTPTTGTSVFAPVARTGTGAAATVTGLGFTPDSVIAEGRGNQNGPVWYDRLRGPSAALRPNQDNSEYTADTTAVTSFNMDGISLGADSFFGRINQNAMPFANWFFKRAPGFFDEVCYTGTGTSGRSIPHNLAAVPELIICKQRSSSSGTRNWIVYAQPLGSSKYLYLNDTMAAGTVSNIWGTQTSTTFGVENFAEENDSGQTFVAYLFASCPGVSKVGSYTGTGTAQTINCGFTGGARFVLIKRTDSTGDWYVWDSARGIVAGNDPYLLLNSAAAEVTSTDYVDTAATGFEISSTAPAAINASGGTFIFLAIA